MIRKTNFRKRGPVESDKLISAIVNTQITINDTIAKAKILIDRFNSLSSEVIASVKRR
jgi:hypothetical protein